MNTLIFRWFLSRTVRHAVDMCRQVRTCWAGTHYFHKVAANSGELRIDPPKTIFPLIKTQMIWVGAQAYCVWFPPEDLENRAGLHDGQMIQKGEEFLKLKVISGD